MGPAAYGEALALPHARPMDFTGKPMRGFVFVDAPGVATDKAVGAWVARGVSFVTAGAAGGRGESGGSKRGGAGAVARASAGKGAATSAVPTEVPRGKGTKRGACAREEAPVRRARSRKAT